MKRCKARGFPAAASFPNALSQGQSLFEGPFFIRVPYYFGGSMGSYKWGYRVPLRVLWRSIGLRVWRVVIAGVISPLIWVITIVTLLITPLIPTHP